MDLAPRELELHLHQPSPAQPCFTRGLEWTLHWWSRSVLITSEILTSAPECKLCAAWDKTWSALSSGGWVLQAEQLGIAPLSDVSAHPQKLVWYFWVCVAQGTKSAWPFSCCWSFTLVRGPAYFSWAKLTAKANYYPVSSPARDMAILYKYSQSIVQAILVTFYPLSFFSSFITDPLAWLFCLHLCCSPFLYLWPHFNYLFWKETHTCVLSAVENFKVIF